MPDSNAVSNQNRIWFAAGLSALLMIAAPFVAYAQTGTTDLRVATLFSDGVVLQQGQTIPIWGWARPRDRVTVSFAGQEKTTTTDANGQWRVELDPLPASAEPRTLTVRGKDTLRVTDVLVGEVWLCSGQSNMAMLLSSVERAKEVMATANDPLLRTFRVANRPAEWPMEDVSGTWLRWERKSAPGFSALGYYFGKRLRKELGVPVGILMSAWGGSGLSSWMSREALQAPALRSLWPYDVVGWRPNIRPSRLYNGMLRPLARFAVAGVLWYQGETDAEAYSNPFLYRFLFPAMIQDWRRLWQRPALPFFWVQLPNFPRPAWPVLRESQSAALRLPYTAMIPTIDIGDEHDLHPKNKEDFAERLADVVLALRYEARMHTAFPVFESMQVDGSRLRLRFRHAEGGLRTTDRRPPMSFQVAGADRRFHDAKAWIERSDVIVESAAVPAPVAIRYAWVPAPRVNLINHHGLPVVPFRTDNFPVTGQEMMPTDLPRRSELNTVVTAKALIKGKHPGWIASPSAASADSLEERRFVRGYHQGAATIAITRKPTSRPSDFPVLSWTRPEVFDPSSGVTAEIGLLIHRAGHPSRGFDLEVGVSQLDGSIRRYLVTVFPLRLHAIQPGEVRVLGANFDNGAGIHRYRLAIRPDGIAQVYYDNELVGCVAGMRLDDPPRKESYLRIGKTVTGGELVANLEYVAFDAEGAFAP